MATLTVRNLDDDIVRRLRMRAAENGRSAEAEHREILRAALASTDDMMARRMRIAAQLAVLREKAAERGSPSVAELLAESRRERLDKLAGPERDD